MNTKQYIYLLSYGRGEADVSGRMNQESLRQAGWRARRITEHRILVEACEDAADPKETGMAERRLEFLRRYLIDKGVAGARLECSVCRRDPVVSSRDLDLNFARSAEIRLFPRVASLSATGPPCLSHEEVSLLDSVRLAVLFPRDGGWQHLGNRAESADWMRILGKPTVREWAEAGARHPLYD